ncbi:hypothetical protein DSECCO2_558860 [anaerobic digester metagenome]
MPIGGNGIPDVQFRVAPHVDNDLVARTQYVIGRGRHVHVGGECEVLTGKEGLPVNAFRRGAFIFGGNGVFREAGLPAEHIVLEAFPRRSSGLALLVEVLVAQALYLRGGDSFLRHLSDDLLLRHAGIAVSLEFLNHLAVADLGKKAACGQQEQQQNGKKSTGVYMHGNEWFHVEMFCLNGC